MCVCVCVGVVCVYVPEIVTISVESADVENSCVCIILLTGALLVPSSLSVIPLSFMLPRPLVPSSLSVIPLSLMLPHPLVPSSLSVIPLSLHLLL